MRNWLHILRSEVILSDAKSSYILLESFASMIQILETCNDLRPLHHFQECREIWKMQFGTESGPAWPCLTALLNISSRLHVPQCSCSKSNGPVWKAYIWIWLSSSQAKRIQEAQASLQEDGQAQSQGQGRQGRGSVDAFQGTPYRLEWGSALKDSSRTAQGWASQVNFIASLRLDHSQRLWGASTWDKPEEMHQKD